MAGLEVAYSLRVRNLHISYDSQLVVNQINGDFEVRDDRMKMYHQKAKLRMERFEKIEVFQISRHHNSHANALAYLASTLASTVTRRITIDYLEGLSIEDVGAEKVLPMCIQDAIPSWMDPIIKYLVKGVLPEEVKEARKVKLKTPRLWMSPDHK